MMNAQSSDTKLKAKSQIPFAVSFQLLSLIYTKIFCFLPCKKKWLFLSSFLSSSLRSVEFIEFLNGKENVAFLPLKQINLCCT